MAEENPPSERIVIEPWAYDEGEIKIRLDPAHQAEFLEELAAAGISAGIGLEHNEGAWPVIVAAISGWTGWKALCAVLVARANKGQHDRVDIEISGDDRIKVSLQGKPASQIDIATLTHALAAAQERQIQQQQAWERMKLSTGDQADPTEGKPGEP
jgi:hypothetical protein